MVRNESNTFIHFPPKQANSPKCLIHRINNSRTSVFVGIKESTEQKVCSLHFHRCCFQAALPLHAWMCKDQLVPFWASGRADWVLENRGGSVQAETLRHSQRLSCVFPVNAQRPLRFSPMRSPPSTHTHTCTTHVASKLPFQINTSLSCKSKGNWVHAI